MPDVIAAPMASTVVSLPVSAGSSFAAGDVLAVVDVMKMEHQLTAASAGRVTEVHVGIGDHLAEGEVIVSIEVIDHAPPPSSVGQPIDLDVIRPELADLHRAERLTSDEQRPDALAKRRSRGQRTARENLADLCDPGTFVEYGRLAVAAQRRHRALDDLRSTTPADGVITGIGAIDGRRCAVLVVDATVIAGTQGYWHHQKIDRILEVAERDHLPVVFFPEGGGGRPSDPDAAQVFTAGLHITSFSAFARLSGRVPLVAIVSGRCFAGSAVFAGCADVIVATADANLGMAGPAMIEGGGMGTYAPEQVGPMSIQAPKGTVDLVVADEQAAVAAAKRYLSFVAGGAGGENAEPADQRELRHRLPSNRRQVYEMRPLLDVLADPGSVFELRRSFGPAAITALARIDGRPVGVVASDPMHQAGAIGPDEADKLARFLRLCDAHGVPIVSLCDCPGFMVGPDVEEAAHVRHASRLFLAGVGLTVPVVAVIVRKAYGLGAMALVGGSLHAPRLTVAWPTAEIGGMGFEGQVQLGMRRELEAIADPTERQATFERAVENLLERGRAVTSAAHLEFDAVIDPADTRRCITAALDTAEPIGKGRNPIDAW
jgi:acetyl-CoA carboxylase carboxyltransferase component